MSPRLQGALFTAIGGVAVYLTVSGRFRDYLKPGMRYPLLAAGLTMLVLGAVTLARTARNRPTGGSMPDLMPGVMPGPPPGPTGGAEQPDAEHHDHGGHGEHGGPPVAWLLALPLLALLLIRPPALGADAARRDSPTRLPSPVSSGYDPLPTPRDGAVDLALAEFMTRAYYDEENSLAGVPVRLTGFVVNDPATPDSYELTRFWMRCCAADAFPVQVTVHGLDSPPPPDDTWVEVVGEWIPPNNPDARGAGRGAAINLIAQTPVAAPSNTYE